MMCKHVVVGLILSLLSCVSVRAQDASGEDSLAKVFPYLSSAQRAELKTDFLAALQKDASLQTEWMQLLQDTGRPAGDPVEMEAMKARILAFEVRIRAAMAKADPNAGAIVDQIDRHMPKLHPELVGK